MKNTILAASILTFTSLAHAHDCDTNVAPGPDTAGKPAVSTGSGANSYMTVPGWGMIPE